MSSTPRRARTHCPLRVTARRPGGVSYGVVGGVCTIQRAPGGAIAASRGAQPHCRPRRTLQHLTATAGRPASAGSWWAGDLRGRLLERIRSEAAAGPAGRRPQGVRLSTGDHRRTYGRSSGVRIDLVGRATVPCVPGVHGSPKASGGRPVGSILRDVPPVRVGSGETVGVPVYGDLGRRHRRQTTWRQGYDPASGRLQATIEHCCGSRLGVTGRRWHSRVRVTRPPCGNGAPAEFTGWPS